MASNKVELISKTIRITRCFDCYDLRKITSGTEFLREEMKKYHLQHMDAILYTNQTLTRFRLILNIHNTGFLCSPEIDEQSKCSLYLRISETLSKLSGVSHVRVAVTKMNEEIRERMQKQEERRMAKQAKMQE